MDKFQDNEDNEDNEDKLTGMAQRQRAGLITPRSQDRNLLPVLFINSHRCIKAVEQSPRPRPIKHIPVWHRGSAL